MKNSVLFILVAFLATSCFVEEVEPRYDARDRIIGRYEMEEYSETFNDVTYYPLYITKSRYSNEIYLENFYASDIIVYAKVYGNKITIPYQVVDGFEVEGVGTVFGNEIEFSYSVDDKFHYGPTDFCDSKAYFDY